MIYASTARFDGTARALTEAEMMRTAPSIFATQAHESRSERFQTIPTIEVLRGLEKEGFVPVGVKQSKTRDPGKAEFTKHLIRLRRIEDGEQYRVGGTTCEILLKNANDGTAAYDLMAGLFRIQCMNSMVAQTQTLDAVKVKHSGSLQTVQTKVIEGTYRVMEEAKAALAAPQDWGQIRMGKAERVAFAQAAHVLRFGDADGNVNTPIQPEQLLTVRRRADNENNLWTTFNVVQENVIKGGLTAYGRVGDKPPRTVTTREIKGIDQDVKLNKALWVLANQMQQIMRSAA